MAMGREGDRQGDLMVTWGEMPRSPGHVFYDRLQEVLIAGGFDGFVEPACQSYYAAKMGAPSVPPGRYFRMHMVGYFEGIASERGIAWRCSDSMSLREFLRLENREKVPDHSWLLKTCGRLPHEIHEKVFGWVLQLVAEQGLVQAKEIGIDTPTADDLVRIDRNRKGKKLSNAEWTSKTDPAAKIAKLKDSRTHLAYKPEHAVDLHTGIIVAAALHPADQGDTTTVEGTLRTAARNLAQVRAAPTTDKPSELVADKGYHSRALLKTLAGGAWNTRIAEPKQWGFSRWHGDDKARAAVYANRTRLGSAVGKQAMRRRAEIVGRSFAHNLDRGGMRRTWLRGRENVHKRYLVHVAGHNLGILMRLLIGAGTPREAAARGLAYLFFVDTEEAVTIIPVAASPDGFAILVIAVTVDTA